MTRLVRGGGGCEGDANISTNPCHSEKQQAPRDYTSFTRTVIVDSDINLKVVVLLLLLLRTRVMASGHHGRVDKAVIFNSEQSAV